MIFSLACGAIWNTLLVAREARSQQEPVRGGWARAAERSDAQFFSRLGRLEGDVGALSKAVSLQPRLIDAWLEISAIEEQRGNHEAALHALQMARRYHAGYGPRWALTNYYLRQGRIGEFWSWARECAHVPYARRGPLIELCLRVDPEGAFRRLGPADVEFQRDFVDLAIRSGAILAAGEVSLQLAGNGEARDRERLLDCCDRLLARGAAAPAVALWDALVRARIIHGLFASHPTGSLTNNEEFRLQPLGRGFDWRLYPGDGIALHAGQGLEIVLTGGQPEDRVAAEQHVAVRPGSLLQLQVDAGANTTEGLSWIVYPLADWTLPLARISLSQPGRTEASFRVPVTVELLRIVLRYQRPVGAVRKPGTSRIVAVRLRRFTS